MNMMMMIMFWMILYQMMLAIKGDDCEKGEDDKNYLQKGQTAWLMFWSVTT